jgi:hypothetical protein
LLLSSNVVTKSSTGGTFKLIQKQSEYFYQSYSSHNWHQGHQHQMSPINAADLTAPTPLQLPELIRIITPNRRTDSCLRTGVWPFNQQLRAL